MTTSEVGLGLRRIDNGTESIASMKNLGILLSGRGSNFVAIADSIVANKISDARIAVVI